MSNQMKDVNEALLSSLLQIPFYPLSYVKVLEQVGHEPLAPIKSINFFGREQLYYPNNFRYCNYIYAVESFSGLYRGLGMKLISHTLSTYVYSRTRRLMIQAEEANELDINKKNTNSLPYLLTLTSNKVTAKCFSIIVSHPFHVMTLRCMVQFIGGETRYSSWNIFQNFLEIYRCEGVAGFFSGLVPRLLFEASTVVLTSALTHLIKVYVTDNKETVGIINLFASIFSSSVTYPLSLVSTVSSVSGCQLIAGQPPRIQYYKSWIDVFKQHYENNQLKRGSTGFFRVYIPANAQNSEAEFEQAGFRLNTAKHGKEL